MAIGSLRSLVVHCEGGDDKDKGTSIWLLGFDLNGHHTVRRLDDGAQTGWAARRLDPESYIGDGELFVYYTLVGDGPSRAPPLPDGNQIGPMKETVATISPLAILAGLSHSWRRNHAVHVGGRYWCNRGELPVW